MWVNACIYITVEQRAQSVTVGEALFCMDFIAANSVEIIVIQTSWFKPKD